MLKTTVFVTYSGIIKGGDFHPYVDLTSPNPWWRHIPDEESLLYASSAVNIGAENNADPSNRTAPTFDNGFVWEDHLHYSPQYLKDMQIANPNILGNVQVPFSNSKTKLKTNKILLHEYKQQKKAFLRAYKKKREMTVQNYGKMISSELEKFIPKNNSDVGKFTELALSSFLHRFGGPSEPDFMMNFPITGENELPHIRDDPQVLSFLPESKMGVETSSKPFDQLLNELDVFQEELNEVNSFDIRAGDHKRHGKAKIYREWRVWQEFITSTFVYTVELGNNKSCHEWLSPEKTHDIPRRVLQERLLEGVMCSNTSAPGCLPSDVLPWLSVSPPAPKFLFSDLSNDIGYRWMLDTEEWFKKQNILLDVAKRESLTDACIHLKSSEEAVEDFYDEKLRNLPPQTQHYGESIPALLGFASDEIHVTKFPSFKPNDGLVHHPEVLRLIICEEYPSFSYGDLTN